MGPRVAGHSHYPGKGDYRPAGNRWRGTGRSHPGTLTNNLLVCLAANCAVALKYLPGGRAPVPHKRAGRPEPASGPVRRETGFRIWRAMP